MLDSVSLTNFKAARELTIPLSSLTLFAGLNGSGKSTVLQAMGLLRQSYEHGESTGLRLGGSLVALGRGLDVLSEGATDETIEIKAVSGCETYVWRTCAPAEASFLEYTEKPGVPHPYFNAGQFQYLQADRIVPRTLYPQTSQDSPRNGFLGAHGEFTVDFLASNASTVVSASRRFPGQVPASAENSSERMAHANFLVEQVAEWMQAISPGVHLQADRVRGTDEVMLQFRYLGMATGRSKNHRPTHVGFGLTYSLPIIVACLTAQPGALLLIENPEAHLHPQGQAKLGNLLARCAADGVQVIVETHSDHLLNGIRLAVKNNDIQAAHVRLCYFTRDRSSGDCYLELPRVLPNGQLSNWPEGFFDEWENSLEALLG
jgi:predicted ATPase